MSWHFLHRALTIVWPFLMCFSGLIGSTLQTGQMRRFSKDVPSPISQTAQFHDVLFSQWGPIRTPPNVVFEVSAFTRGTSFKRTDCPTERGATI